MNSQNIYISRKKRINENEFFKYLVSNAMLAEKTARGYITAIYSLEDFANRNNLLSRELFIYDSNIVIRTVKEIEINKKYIELNKISHNRHRSAVNKLLEFLHINYKI